VGKSVGDAIMVLFGLKGDAEPCRLSVESAIEALCKTTGRTLVVTESVYQALTPSLQLPLLPLGNASLKRRQQRAPVYGLRRAGP
jgi:class 3 adenylate cyclase